MCGILGITTKKEYRGQGLKAMAEILLRLSESRGKEAAGFAVKRNDSIDILKLPVGAGDFLRSFVYKKFSGNTFNGASTIIGHSRLATHGTELNNDNNQPVAKDNAVCVHNGIIANDGDLWRKYPQLKRNYQVDTEVFLSLLQWFLSKTGSIAQAVKKTFEEIEGSASVAVLFNNRDSLLLATNTGSLYFFYNCAKDAFAFASERYILEQFADKVKSIDLFKKEEIKQLSPGTAFLVDTQTSLPSHQEVKFVDYAKNINFPEISVNKNNNKLLPETKKVMHENWQRLYSLYGEGRIKRCAKCLLPETMTFIDFDEHGVCNYCRDYKKIGLKNEDELKEIVSQYRRSDGRPDCVVGFSGGRDSSYGLHYIKKVLKMNPIAYTYDWGVLTDLGRRNQARVCGKLGVEHIIISADIRRKRANVLVNLNAWLRKPEMGMIPLLMAGDKKHVYCGDWLKKKVGAKLSIYCVGNGLENEFFKIGLVGVRMNSEMRFSKLSAIDKMRATAYYAYQYIRNPSYINQSLLDTIFAYYYSFVHQPDSLDLFRYIKWDEKEIVSTIINEYNWEREPDTVATWRIDDGTAPFYNYIYLTVMGLTEFDTFRSIQIREGQISREKAYEIIKEENKPRYESIEWYARIIGLDINEAIKRINGIPKFYEGRT